MASTDGLPVNTKYGGCVGSQRHDGHGAIPSYTMTRSDRYVAMIKSCSTTKAVFFACKMKRLITCDQRQCFMRTRARVLAVSHHALEATRRCSESR